MANYQKAKDIFIQRKTTNDTFEEYPLIVSPNCILLTDNCSDLVMINTQSLLESSSYATTSSYSSTASYALVSGTGGGTSLSTGSLYPITASWSETSSFSTSASYAMTASSAESASYSFTSSNSISASYALNAGTTLSTGSLYPITSSWSVTASISISSSYSTTASYALNGGSSGVANITASSIATGSVTASVDVGNSSFSVINNSNYYLFISSSGNVGIGATTALNNNKLSVGGNISASVVSASIISTGTSLVIQGSSPILNLATGSSAILITQSLSQSNAMGSSIYGVSFNQIMTNSTASQTQTAFRVIPTFAGNFTGSNTSNIIADFGATNVGTQFSVNDVTSGSIYMVNDVSGLPIIEAMSDWQVNIYDYPNVLFNKSGSYLTLGSVAAPTSSVTVRSDYIFDKGIGVTYKQVQVSGSTYGAVTSSIYNLAFGSVSASVYLNAIITGYDTGSNDVITGDLKATIRYRNNVASVVGSITKFVNSDANVSFDLTASSNSASLMVYGSSSRYYKWGGTITTQVI